MKTRIFIVLYATYPATFCVGGYPTRIKAIRGIRDFIVATHSPKARKELSTGRVNFIEDFIQDDLVEELKRQNPEHTSLIKKFVKAKSSSIVADLYEELLGCGQEDDVLDSFELIEHPIGEIFPFSDYDEWTSVDNSLERLVSLSMFGKEYEPKEYRGVEQRSEDFRR